MPKFYLEVDVLTAAQKRIEWTFDTFERICVSFSAGKDSTVMAELVAQEARRRGVKVGLMLIDLEGQYKLTIEHALNLIERNTDVFEVYWICLPLQLRNAVSVYQPLWRCWDPERKKDWIRTPPDIAITDPSYFPFFVEGMEFEEFVPEFGDWYAQGQRCAIMVGIRTDESLNRYRTLTSDKKTRCQGKQYTTEVTSGVYNVYPIYDWKTEDIWTYHAQNPDVPYNDLYELMNKAGLPLSEQRICQPYGDDQRRGLWLFHLIEPETWAKIVARVNGANSGALYVTDSGNINGYNKIHKPDNHTWQSFADLFLSSVPEKLSEHYKNKIFTFVQWWQQRGYPDGIPDEAPDVLEAKRLVPSWRRVCKSLLRNDYWCKGLGFSQQKTAAYSRYLELKKNKRKANGFTINQKTAF